ncbi:MAG TPA: DUF4870 domain-containing protein [Lachnospiraceae bacterium]|nr:DUF4870 domain-containing protein [Lachnospiraceae bacterium]
MSYCGNCGKRVESGIRFCPSCGMPMPGAATEQRGEQIKAEEQQAGVAVKVKGIGNTADTTSDFLADDITQNKAMAILAYFGPLVLIPIFAAPTSKFARYHANQGLVLLITCIIYGIVEVVLSSFLWIISWYIGSFVSSLLGLLWILFTVLAIIGIINAASGRAKELPVIGKFKILK